MVAMICPYSVMVTDTLAEVEIIETTDAGVETSDVTSACSVTLAPIKFTSTNADTVPPINGLGGAIALTVAYP
jgi:hypothetical protein